LVFVWLDNLKACVFGVELNWWRHHEETRFSVLVVAGLAGLMWLVQGFDSGVGEYGVSMHWSVFVIYGLFYYFTSINLEKNGVIGSKNVFISFILTGFCLAMFEWFWMLNYYMFYGESWILFHNSHILPNTVLTVAGLAAIFYVNTLAQRTYKITSVITLLMLAPSIIWMMIGFPQTCYPQADGTIVYIENNRVHLLNVLAKGGVTWWVYETIKKIGVKVGLTQS